MKSSIRNGLVLVLAISFSIVGLAAAQHDMPAGMTHEQHQAQMKKEAEMKQRGNVAMGFDQDKTTHHFLLQRDGGAIQVETNTDADTESRDAIRHHLKTIAEQFAKGDFSAPFATHNQVIPGVATMQRLASAITYSYEERRRGATVLIKSADPKAIKATHQFLQYQIREHKTGDSLTAQK